MDLYNFLVYLFCNLSWHLCYKTP